MRDQAARFGLETILTEVTGLELQGDLKAVKTTDGDFTTRTVILASGSERQKLGVPGEEEFTGKGVSYCATCDAAFFRDQPVAVAGGGNAAITEALHLAKLTSKVTVIHRRDQLRATKILQEKAFAEPQNSDLEVAGLFISIGFRPDTDYLKGLLTLDGIGHIITNEKMETGIAGIFAAGDIRQNSGRQAITAAGDGATAAIYTEEYLTNF